MSKYLLDEKIFETIKNEESAYLLGLIIADGSIASRKNNYTLRIALAEPIEYMKMLANSFYINKDANLYYRPKQKVYHKQQISLIVCRKKIIKDLKKLGVTANKSFTVKFPDIKNKVLQHMIRGFFDGDGCLYSRYKKGYLYKQYEIGFACNKYTAEQLQNIIKSELDMHVPVYADRQYRKVCMNGNNQVERFLDWLYEDATLYIPRKYEKYQELKIQQKEKKARKIYGPLTSEEGKKMVEYNEKYDKTVTGCIKFVKSKFNKKVSWYIIHKILRYHGHK